MSDEDVVDQEDIEQTEDISNQRKKRNNRGDEKKRLSKNKKRTIPEGEEEWTKKRVVRYSILLLDE